VVVRRVLLTAGRESAQANREDLVQEVIEKVLTRNVLASFESRHHGSARSFLGKVAVNHVRDRLRADRREQGRLAVPGGEEEDPLALLPERAAWTESIERHLLFQEIDRALELSDSVTAQQDCEIFWLHYQQGWTARQISELPWITLSVKGVEASLFRTTKMIKGKFGKPRAEGHDQ